MLNSLDLFSGIGGLTLALENYCKPLYYCEKEPYARAVLASRILDGSLPKAGIFRDVTKLDGTKLSGEVDIIVGGFPCQDLSVAGHGKGLGGERSGLFFEIIRIACETKAPFIFLENVPGIASRGLSQVAKTLTDNSYDARWMCLSAKKMGAHHTRNRWFLLAYSNGKAERSNTPRQYWRNTSKSNSGNQKKIRKKPFSRSRDGDFPFSYCARPPENPWQIEPQVGRMAHGIPYRMDSLKSLGNAVVPLQAQTAFEYLAGLRPLNSDLSNPPIPSVA